MLSCLRALPRQSTVVAVRSLRTSALTRDAKTPIQQWGWEYLVRQEASGRPLSPHLNIYKPQLTWMVSGAHRIFGCIMAGTLLIGGLMFSFTPLDFTNFVEAIRDWELPRPIVGALKFIVAYPIIFHTLNGGFDLAKGTDIATVYKTGWAVIAISAILALAIVLNSTVVPPTKTRK